MCVNKRWVKGHEKSESCAPSVGSIMASDGVEESPVQTKDPKEDETCLTDSTSLQTKDPSDPNFAQNTLDTAARHGDARVDVCQFFLMGKCRFGQNCRLSHSDPPKDDSGAALSDPEDKQHQERMEKRKKKLNKATKPKFEAKEVNKKPRMRTADEVISRILWDPSVASSEFVVGYVDRFLGVLERPFDEFNWDTDPCDCDYTSELALPRHRIQYFSFRGHRVWDRHTRTDRVFGSTGQSLAPPFGGEEEVKEPNAENQEQQQEEQPPAVPGREDGETEECTLPENTNLEEEKPGEMKEDLQESQGARVSEEAAVRPEAEQASSSQREGGNDKQEADDEWQESWEGNEDCSSHINALNISQSQSPLEQREKKGGGRPPKKRPTHFITFRANTPAVLSCFQQLQEELTALLPSSAPHWQNSSCLHVTMCLLMLPSPAEVAAAADILRQFAHLDRNPPVSLTFPVKLKHFSGRVLYLSPQPQLHLQQLNAGLQEAFRNKGLLHRDSYNPRYHLTLAKIHGEEERIFEGVEELKVGKGLNFGRLPVNTLHLCAVGGAEVEDFYETVCSVNLR